jgi:hypothetical protein
MGSIFDSYSRKSTLLGRFMNRPIEISGGEFGELREVQIAGRMTKIG